MIPALALFFAIGCGLLLAWRGDRRAESADKPEVDVDRLHRAWLKGQRFP